MTKTAIILAGGSGTRAGGDVPKQFRFVAGFPVLWWSVTAFLDADPDTRIIIVLSPQGRELWESLFEELPAGCKFSYIAAVGGKTRWESVKNGLEYCADDGLIAVHDGARPMVTPEIINRGWELARLAGAAVPAVALTDSIRRILSDSESVPEDRSLFRAVQTPQIFGAEILKNAYSFPERVEFTDDASVVEHCGGSITLFTGSPENIKITHAPDFILAESILSRRSELNL